MFLGELGWKSMESNLFAWDPSNLFFFLCCRNSADLMMRTRLRHHISRQAVFVFFCNKGLISDWREGEHNENVFVRFFFFCACVHNVWFNSVFCPVGESSDSTSGQSLPLRHLQFTGYRGPVCQAAEGDPGQEFCQLFRVLWEVGAGGACQQTLQGDRREQEIKWVFIFLPCLSTLGFSFQL